MVVFRDSNKAQADSGSEAAGQQLDVAAAIQAHVQWKLRLLAYINGESEEELDPDVVGSDCLCSLGHWIYGHGADRYGDHPKFLSLKAIHADFHTYAGDVVRAVNDGEKEHALRLLQRGEYPKVSNRIKSMLAGISLEFDFT